MMKSLGKYVRKKKLVKIMVFKKRKRKSEENEWKREGRKIERMREIKYLGYTFNEKTTDKAHMREIVRKTNKVVGCVWGIGERKWGDDFRRKMMIFESMIERNIDVLGRNLGIEGIRRDRENARKVFETGARSEQRNARLHSVGRVQEVT
jgi:hypothetical protein